VILTRWGITLVPIFERRWDFFIPMSRVHVYIDGFNLYHSLVGVDGGAYRWLDLHALASQFLEPEDNITRVAYFSAYAHWKPESLARHKVYADALRFSNVEVILSRFQYQFRDCHHCEKKSKYYVEKKTDVRLAIEMQAGAFKGDYDKLFLLTADSDQVPTIQSIKTHFPEIHIKMLLPPNQNPSEHKKYSDTHHKITRKHLAKSLLPDVVGAITIPTEWM